MKIINTGIDDVNFQDIDESKLNLANKIIKVIYPIINDLHLFKSKEFDSLKNELKNKTKKIKQIKEELQELMVDYQKQKKMKKLLEQISKIVSSGSISTKFRNESIILLKVIESLSEDKLNYHLNETIKIKNKKN